MLTILGSQTILPRFTRKMAVKMERERERETDRQTDRQRVYSVSMLLFTFSIDH